MEHQEALEQLKQALKQLSQHTLPIETRAALHNAQLKLNEFEANLEKSSRQSQLDALYKVSQSLGISLNLDDVLTQVMDAVIELTGAERGFLMLVNPESGELVPRAARNIDKETIASKDMQLSRSVIQTVIRTGEGVVTTDAQNDPRFSGQQSVVFYALRSILCAPLRARGNTIGVIYVDNRAQSGIFTPEDLDLLNTFASQAAIAIDNARLYTTTDQALSQRVKELETLSIIDQELNQNLDLYKLCQIIQDWLAQMIKSQRVWLRLEQKNEDDEPTYRLIGDDFPEQILSLEKTNISEINTEIQITQYNAQHFAICPLKFAHANFGELIVASSSPFSTNDLIFLHRFVIRATTAIKNAMLYQDVQRANQAKTRFVSIVTHELRIPLTSIKGYTDLLRQGVVGPVNSQQHNFLDVIRNNVDRMAALISDLSDISRIERGILKLNMDEISLKQYADETLQRLQPNIEEKNQSLQVDIPPNLPTLYADPNRLVQILTNLVSNAWKYTPEGGKIFLRALPLNSMVKVEVQDTGIGISEQDQKKIFSQFFRSEDPAVREVTGWGLGLNVTKKIVELMGGEIGFTSKLGQGTTFWFTLPAFQGQNTSSGTMTREKSVLDEKA